MTDVYAYASNASLVQLTPHPTILTAPTSIANNVGSDTQQAFIHSDTALGSTRHRWTPEMV